MIHPDPNMRPNIQKIENTLQSINASPAKRAKRIDTASVLVLAAGISLISLYSNYKIRQAQKESEAMNTLLSDTLMKSSPIEDGKHVLLVDVLAEAENRL